MSVCRRESGQHGRRRSHAQTANAARVSPVDATQAAPQRRRGPRVPDPIVSVDSTFSAQTPVSAAEVDAILRLVGDDLDLILGGDKFS